jgi:hypothetical protein
VTALLLLVLAADPDDVDQAMREATALSPAAGRAHVQEWIAAHRGAPGVATARFWLAVSFASESRFVDADLLLAALVSEGSSVKWDAALLRADLELQQRHWAIAEDEYRAIAAPKGSRWEYEASERAEVARWAGLRQHAMWGLLAGLVTLAAWRTYRGRRALWPPPEEVLWAGPLLVLMLAAALPRAPEERSAIALIALGGFVLLWVNGAWLKVHELSFSARVRESLLGLAQAAAALYCAIIASGLWDSVMNTFAAGPA